MISIEIGFKNGMKLKAKCDTCDTEYDQTTGELCGYKMTNMKGNAIKYLNVNEVVYIVKKV